MHDAVTSSYRAHNTLFISELASQQHRLPEHLRQAKTAATKAAKAAASSESIGKRPRGSKAQSGAYTTHGDDITNNNGEEDGEDGEGGNSLEAGGDVGMAVVDDRDKEPQGSRISAGSRSGGHQKGRMKAARAGRAVKAASQGAEDMKGRRAVRSSGSEKM